MVHRDNEVMANRPDINTEKRRKMCVLIDVVLPADRNVTQKKAEKKLATSLCTEIQRTWNMKCMIIPVVIGYT
jgi:hypothetical protein